MAIEGRQAFIQSFLNLFGNQPRLFYAPGRVNLIGEHTDYNEGFVLPLAIDRGITVAASSRMDDWIEVHSLAFGNTGRFRLGSVSSTPPKSWLTYVEGMVESLLARGVRLHGTNLLIGGDLPVGAGLSSSAALLVAIGSALCGISGYAIEPMMIVMAAHSAETGYVGTQSGIMDPYVSVFAKEGFCLLLDCRSLESRRIPFHSEDYAPVITDTRVKHALASGEYNSRRKECHEGVAILQRLFSGIKTLRDVDLEQFYLTQHTLPGKIRARCRHVLTENARTLDAARALNAADFRSLGLLMFQSHESLRRDFEVTIPELDFLVEAAARLDYVAGSRMTGGGFGGCTISLVRRTHLTDFREVVSHQYDEMFGVEPLFMVATPSEGTREL